MLKESWNNEYQRRLEITIDGDTHPTVTVYQCSSLRSFMLEEAQINWAAIGSTSPEIAEQYALALIVAADQARTWNKDTGTKLQST